MNNFNVEVPINSLSLGQLSYRLLVEIFNRGLTPNIFPLGPVDFKSFLIPTGFIEWFQEHCNKAETQFSVDDPSISLWHVQGSHKRISKKNVLWVAHETDFLTDTEANILKNFDKVLTTSNYSKDVFSKKLTNVDWCPNFFDDLHFYKTNREYRNSKDVTTFGLFGKLEKRKHTINILVAWANAFGNKKEFRLNCCIYNPFIPQDVQSAQISSIFKGQIPWNINILPFQESNVDYNNVLNSIDIDITGLSGAEGWNLPTFNALCLGKQSVVLNAHAHTDFADNSNSFLVDPNGTTEIYDDVFFKKGARVNQGNMYTFDANEAQRAMLAALSYAKTENVNGEKLKEKFSVGKSLDILLNSL